jgi:hypothetical protein
LQNLSARRHYSLLFPSFRSVLLLHHERAFLSGDARTCCPFGCLCRCRRRLLRIGSFGARGRQLVANRVDRPARRSAGIRPARTRKRWSSCTARARRSSRIRRSSRFWLRRLSISRPKLGTMWRIRGENRFTMCMLSRQPEANRRRLTRSEDSG